MALAPASSMAEGLTAMMPLLDGLELAPDADPEFVSNLRAMLVSKIRESTAADLTNKAGAIGAAGPSGPSPTGPSAMGADLGGNLAPPPPGAPPMPMGGGGPLQGPSPGGMGAGAAGPGRGNPMAPPMPDEDSLRRILNVG